jgi:hypothetical protein
MPDEPRPDKEALRHAALARLMRERAPDLERERRDFELQESQLLDEAIEWLNAKWGGDRACPYPDQGPEGHFDAVRIGLPPAGEE